MSAVPEQNEDGSERRIAPRQRVLKRAKVIFNGGFSTIDAIVRNISSTGALLTLDDAVHLPKQFRISIGETADRPARLVYRRSMFAGIRFLDISEEAEAEEPEAAAGVSYNEASPAEASRDWVLPAEETQAIRYIKPQPLPRTLTRHFSWF